MVLASYEFLSVVRGHHVYKDIWTPVIDEELAIKKEDLNEQKQSGCDLSYYVRLSTQDTSRRLALHDKL